MNQTLNVVLPLLSTVISFVFAAMVLDQWRERRRSFQMAWAVGLLWYGISAGTEFWGSAFGWSEPLYRAWYLIGALYVAAYLGLGTVYLLTKTRFGYFVAVSVAAGGLFAYLSQLRLIREGRPADWSAVYGVIGVGFVAALVIAYVTARHRELTAHITMLMLVGASVVAATVVLSAPVEAPGYAVDPGTHVPVGSAMAGYVRLITGPFNIMGGLCLTFGAVFSTYVYMPKRKILRGRALPPVVAQFYGAIAVVVNLIASIPTAAAALRRGEVSSRVPATILIAIGGFIPGVTSGLNRFGVTWSFFLGEFLGVLFIFLGFLVSEEVIREVRVAFTNITLWRRPEPRAVAPPG